MAVWPIRSRLLMWLPFVQASIAYATDMWRLVRDAVMENLIVRTIKVGGSNLIELIKAVSGC